MLTWQCQLCSVLALMHAAVPRTVTKADSEGPGHCREHGSPFPLRDHRAGRYCALKLSGSTAAILSCLPPALRNAPAPCFLALGGVFS